ncbi:choline transporter-like 1 [Brevipalpus obovatus]|uniref:choline transporter-like 1 n=1 Tax=Brevipalpus obovatus TaxID=246614 RepID=UPI003D9F5D1D
MSETKTVESDDIILKSFRDRKPTDKPCLYVSFVFLIVSFAVCLYSFHNGQPQRYANGFDSYGNTCGIKNRYQDQPGSSLSGQDHSNRTFLFWLHQTNFSNSPQLCIKACPDENIMDTGDLVDFYHRTGSSLCRYDINIDGFAKEAANSKEIGPRYDIEWTVCPKLPVPKMVPVFHHCVPTYFIQSASTLVLNFFSLVRSKKLLEELVVGLIVGKSMVLTMITLSLIFSFMIIVLLHHFASTVSRIIMHTFLIGVFIVTALLWYGYFVMKSHNPEGPFIQDEADRAAIAKLLFISASMFSLLSGSFLLAIYSIRKNLRLIVALFKESSSCFQEMPFLLIIPVGTLITLIVFHVVWLATLIFLLSNPEFGDENLIKNLALTGHTLLTNKTMNKHQYAWEKFQNHSRPWLNFLVFYLIISLFWGSEFIIGCQRALVSATISTWYFNRDRKKSKNPMISAIHIVFKKHLGSVAMGSFLMIVLTMPMAIPSIRRFTAVSANSLQHSPVKKFLEIIRDFLIRIEKCLGFLTYNAYTMMAIQGDNFCVSGRKAGVLMLENSLKVFTINTVGYFVLFLAKVTVALLCVFIGVSFLKDDDMEFFSAPIAIGFILSYIVSGSVLSIYEMIIDSLFLCTCHDKNTNESKDEGYFGPQGLKEVLQEELEEKKYDKNAKKEEEFREELEEIIEKNLLVTGKDEGQIGSPQSEEYFS